MALRLQKVSETDQFDLVISEQHQLISKKRQGQLFFLLLAC